MAANPTTDVKMPPIIKGTDLMTLEIPELRWAVEGIIPEGGAVLAGRPKTGKSWLALNIALAVVSGGVALGKIKVEYGEVLYLALEDNHRRLQARLRKVLERQCMTIPDGIYLATDWPRADRGGREAIDQWLEEHAWTRLVIIDTLARFRGKNSLCGDKYQEDYDEMGNLQKIASNRNRAILAITHDRKPKAGGGADFLDDVQGTTGSTGAADAVLVLKRPRMSRTATLFITGRDVEEREIPLAVDEQFCLWSITTPDTSDPDAGLDQDRRAVRAAIRKAGHALSPAEVAHILKKSPEAARKLLSRMKQDGYLRQEGYGRYELPEHSESHLSHGHTDEIPWK
jgi:hypothetical protein